MHPDSKQHGKGQPGGDTLDDPRTVFVRGLDPAVTDGILSSHFSTIGPVSHAFTVKKRGSSTLNLDHHKGFGFVQFALEGDAVRAVQEMHGTRLEGRVMKVEGAKKREKFEVRKERVKEEKAQAAAEGKGGVASNASNASPRATGDEKETRKGNKGGKRKERTQSQLDASQLKHKLVRTVAVGGLRPDDVPGVLEMVKKLTVKTTVKVPKGRKGSEERDAEVELVCESTVYPVPEGLARQYRLEQDGCSGDVVLVQYASVKDALSAVRVLHGRQEVLSAVPGTKKRGGKRRDGGGATTATTLWARQVSGDGLYLKKHRVVVRNLPFDASEEDVRGVFGGRGFFLWEVTLPRGVGGEGRGFAFVGFVCRQDAERAIGKVNGEQVKGRVVAVDWAVSKREFEEQEKSKGKEAEKEKESQTEKGGAQKRAKVEAEDAAGKRAKPGQELAGESDEEEIDLDEEKSRVNNVLDSILGGSSRGDDDYFEEIEEDGSDGSDDSDDSDDSDNDADAKASAAATAAAAQHPAVSKLNETADQLAASLSNHKTKEPYTVEPGATVFIRNVPIDATQKTVFEAMKRFGFVKSTRIVVNKQTSRPKGTAFVDFRSAVDAEAAAAASQQAIAKTGPPVLIAGKPVEIHVALGADDIRDLAVRKSKGLKHADPASSGRNLYLAQEGRIAENSTAWNALSNSDKEKRARAANESELKLKSPNFAVSKTRLNVRNVPKNWDDRKLKALFVKAVKARATKENPKIVQVKILTNPSGGSKGIAFIEFKQHDHALCALRELNNNPDTWSKDHRPIVEFAIDNVQALKKRTMNLVKQRDSLDRKSTGTDIGKDAATKKKAKKAKKADDGNAGDEPKSKRKLRMERRQMLKQKNRNANNPNAADKDGVAKGADAKMDKLTTTGTTGTTGKGKAARRREQRAKKAKQDMAIAIAIDGLAKTGVAPATTTNGSNKRKKPVDNSLEAKVEARIGKQARAHAGGTRTRTKPVSAKSRWFDE